MDSTILAFIPFMLCALGIVLVGSTIGYLVIQRFRQARSPQGRAALVAQAHQWLATERSRLLPWHDQALTDIAASSSIQWQTFVITHLYGTINAITHPQPIIAFYGLDGPGFTSTWVVTSAHWWELERHGSTLSIQLNGRLWGSWQAGKLFDAAGSPVGEARIGGSTWLPQDDQWYDVILNGRVIGAVLHQRGLRTTWHNPPRQLLRPAVNITGDEQLWLLTVAVVDVTSTARARSTSMVTGPLA